MKIRLVSHAEAWKCKVLDWTLFVRDRREARRKHDQLRRTLGGGVALYYWINGEWKS